MLSRPIGAGRRRRRGWRSRCVRLRGVLLAKIGIRRRSAGTRYGSRRSAALPSRGVGGHLDWPTADRRWRHRGSRILLHIERLRGRCTGTALGWIRLPWALLRTRANRGLNSLNLGHVRDANIRTGGGRTLAQLLDISRRKWPSGVLDERGLLPREGHWRWRRSRARNHRPAERGGGRTGVARWCATPDAQHAGLLRRDLRNRGDARRAELRSRHGLRAFRDTAAIGEAVLRDRGNGVRHYLVHILNVRDGVVRVAVVVVVVVDRRAVERRVRVVDPREVTLTDPVGGEIGLARPKREPSDRRGVAGREAHAEANPAPVSSDPAHERWRVNRRLPVRTRNPAPAAVERSPAAIV